MRDIKFRAWNKNQKKMVGPYELTNDCICDVLIQYGSSALIWTQFTCLYDKNGKEIYEGDIVTNVYINGEYYTGNHEVVFIGSSFCIRIKKGINIRHDYEPCLDEAWLEMIEVMGNIYENPELLEEGMV